MYQTVPGKQIFNRIVIITLDGDGDGEVDGKDLRIMHSIVVTSLVCAPSSKVST
jgi:hypothetical protein